VANRRPTRTDRRPKKKPAAKQRARSQRSAIVLRWCILGVVVLVGFLYYQPLSSYLETRSALNERSSEVDQLEQERNRLQARLAHSSTLEALAREARIAGLVRPGERLFIVKGAKEWRRAHARAQKEAGATIAP
jgi:hypothetical protein